MSISRQTAFKLRIYDIKNNNYVRDIGEWASNYIIVNGTRVSRVNVIANVVMKNGSTENSYISIGLDDGTEVIKVKSWRDDTKILQNINIGDFVLVIGRVREFNNEIFITPEIVRKIDSEWALVRKIDLEKMYGVFDNSIRGKIDKETAGDSYKYESVYVSQEKIESVNNETKRQIILNLVEKFDTEIGADINEIINNSNYNENDTKMVINELLKEGEIFQIREGRIKIIG